MKDTPKLKTYLNEIIDEDFTNQKRADVLKISLTEALVALAGTEHKKGFEFPRLLKLEQVRHAISVLKRLNADLNNLQERMESAYGLCKGLG